MRPILFTLLFLGLLAGKSFAKNTPQADDNCPTFSPAHLLGQGIDTYVVIRNGNSTTATQVWYRVKFDCVTEQSFVLWPNAGQFLSSTETYRGRYVVGSLKHLKFEWELIDQNGRKQSLKLIMHPPDGTLSKESVFCPAKPNAQPFEWDTCRRLP